MPAKKKPKTGRPPLPIDPVEVEKLSQLQCTYEEMGAFFGCDKATLSRRFATVIAKGREAGKRSLRRAQWQTALGGNVVMQIFLGKNYLGQADKQEIEASIRHTEERKALDIGEVKQFLVTKKQAGLNGGKREVLKNVSRTGDN